MELFEPVQDVDGFELEPTVALGAVHRFIDPDVARAVEEPLDADPRFDA